MTFIRYKAFELFSSFKDFRDIGFSKMLQISRDFYKFFISMVRDFSSCHNF